MGFSRGSIWFQNANSSIINDLRLDSSTTKFKGNLPIKVKERKSDKFGEFIIEAPPLQDGEVYIKGEKPKELTYCVYCEVPLLRTNVTEKLRASCFDCKREQKRIRALSQKHR